MQPATTHGLTTPGTTTPVEFGGQRGEYVFVDRAEDAGSALRWMLEAATAPLLDEGLSVGIDIETTSLAPAEGRVRLTQVAASERCVVLDCFAFDVWGALRAAVDGLTVSWIAHNAVFEQGWLSHHGGFTLTPMFDTRWVFVRERVCELGSFVGHGSNLAQVCRELLGFELDKQQRLSDWSQPQLTAAQIEYAALDALVLIPLRERLERTAIDNGWVAEVSEAAEHSLAEARRFG